MQEALRQFLPVDGKIAALFKVGNALANKDIESIVTRSVLASGASDSCLRCFMDGGTLVVVATF
jgi:hypothetical protein